MTSSDVITPGDEHRDELVGLMRVAFNMSSGTLAERAAWLPVEKMRCVLEGDRIVAAAGAKDFRQWWGGRELEMSGIWGVVTLPEHRGGGLATRAVTELLEAARARGQTLSVLYPATQRPYRGMGYELAGTMTRHAVALDDLPRGAAGPLTVEEYAPERDLDAVRACYRASVSSHQGPIDSDEGDWWPSRVLGRWFSDDVQRAVVARGRIGHRGVRVVHARLGSRRPARVRVRDQLPAPGGDLSGGVGVVAVVPARVPRPGADAEVHRSSGASARVAGRGAAGSARLVVPVDAAAARRSGGAVGPRATRRCRRSSSCRSRTACSRRTEARGGWSRRAGWCRSGRLGRGAGAADLDRHAVVAVQPGSSRPGMRWRSGWWTRRRRRGWPGCSAGPRRGCTTSSNAWSPSSCLRRPDARSDPPPPRRVNGSSSLEHLPAKSPG